MVRAVDARIEQMTERVTSLPHLFGYAGKRLR
jgi:hypothetical protein